MNYDFWRQFRHGFADVIPVTVAAAPFGFLLGTIAVQKGLVVAQVSLMSASVYAGASQFVALDMWRQPVPWLAITVATLLVNLRHVLMGASLSRKLAAFSPLGRNLAMLFMVDETWALAEARAAKQQLSPAYYLGMNILLYPSWILNTSLGVIFGGLMNDPRVYGFDFAFTAIFIALIVGFWRGAGTGVVLAAAAIVAVGVHAVVDGPWYIAAGGIAGALAGAFLPERAGALEGQS